MMLGFSMGQQGERAPFRVIKTSRLSRREREVAELVSQGLTNREIAGQLFLSERTIEGHIAKIAAKVGVRSRVQIATWMLESGALLPTSAPVRSAARWRPQPRPLLAVAVTCLVLLASAAVLVGRILAPTTASAPVISTVLAGLSGPAGVASDPKRGVVYIADTGNDEVRVISSTGTTRKLAGLGTKGATGLAVDPAGRLYIADTGNNRVLVVTRYYAAVLAGAGRPGFSGDNGPAAAAQLDSPEAVAVDGAGNVYIADTGNDRIRVVDAKTGTIATVAGGGQADPFTQDYLGLYALTIRLHHPEGVAVDSIGNLFISDTRAQAIYELSKAAQGSFGPVQRLVGTGVRGFTGDGGPAPKAKISDPRGMAVDAQGRLYFADSGNNRIRRFNRGMIESIAGDGRLGSAGDQGTAVSAQLAVPAGVSADAAGGIYIADTGNGRVRVVGNSSLNQSVKPAVRPTFASGSFMAQIQARGKLIAEVRGGPDTPFPFFAFRNPDTHELEGFDIDMMRAVAKAIFGRDDSSVLELRTVARPDRMSALKQGAVDIADAMLITDANATQVDLSDPYLRTVDLMVVRKGSPIASFADSGGKRVCVVYARSFSLAADLAQAQPRLGGEIIGSREDCLTALKSGQVDAVFGHSPDTLAMAAEDPSLNFTSALTSPRMWGWAVPKGHPEFVQFLNHLLQRVQADGRWKAAAANWLNGYEDTFDPLIR